MPCRGQPRHLQSCSIRVTVTLDSPSIEVYGQSQALKAGMLLEADIIQDRRRLYEWALEPLYSVTGRWPSE